MTDTTNNVTLVYSKARLNACAHHVSRLNNTTFTDMDDVKDRILGIVHSNMDKVLSRYSENMYTIQTAGFVVVFYGVDKETNTCQVEFMIDPYIADIDHFQVPEGKYADDHVNIECSNVPVDTE